MYIAPSYYNKFNI